ncbi:GH3 auxin-responsive promoter [Tumidithrix helvetica PCC 7403]|uniref:GH3 family domain-containing protein n=1 Tax=Tumidithrix helvetica TaxID=3457545 RepID=UPI003CA3FA90
MRGLIQLFKQFLKPSARRFHQALDFPELAQASVQQVICDRLVESVYGRSLEIRSIADWQKVPIINYDDLEPWITRTRAEKPSAGILTPECILSFAKTSGSSGSCKWIPYTRSLQQSFSQMFCVWAQDLIEHGPRFSTGKLYACISPQLIPQDDASAKVSDRLSGQDDTDYLDGWLQWFLRPFLVSPKQGQEFHDPQGFMRQLCQALLQAERLETISIWSPSFLQVHLNYIQAHRRSLWEALQQQMSRDRLQLLTETDIPWTQLWSNLKLISCWDSANAADRAEGLRSQFPNVLVQGKGLLATEAPITIPLIVAQGYVPVLNEVFFEFEDDTGALCLLHELSMGKTYTIVLSQKGGLYRYRLGDRVRVTHWYRQTPCLEFLGRSHATSDLVGEKLSEGFVQNAMKQLNLPSSCFKSLVPVAEPPHYLLLLDRATDHPEAIASQLDRALSQSYQYHQARLLGQLEAPQVSISDKIPELLAIDRAIAGKIWGGIKHPLLATTAICPELLRKLQAIA